MLAIHILQGTPLRVWILLAGLVALGLSQVRPRTLGLGRATLMPAAMVALSLAGVVTSFGSGAAALAAWAAGLAAALALAPQLMPRVQASWSAAGDSVRVAGSAWPLARILALFATKYAAGVGLALHPGFAADAGFVLPFGFAYGLFSGTFAARGWQLWQARGGRADAAAVPA